jgi:DNA polymerase III subunit alpha
MAHSDFVHLHVHTQYSLLDGACQLDRLVDKAVREKLPALAITDHGNICGAIQFYSLCLKKGVKPIIGCEMYMAPGSRHDKEGRTDEDGGNNHLILLAKNDEGYRNLIKLVSISHLEGFYYKPRVDKEAIAQHCKGLIASSACLKGEIPSLISAGKIDQAHKAADWYFNVFGEGNFYLELMENLIPEQAKVNKELINISRKLNIPLVATNDIHYLDKEDSFAHEVLLGIQTQTTLSDPKRFKFNSDTFYFRSPAEMKALFTEVPQAIKNTLEITQKCNLTFDFSKIHLPHFPLPAGETDEGYLRKLVLESLPVRYPGAGPEVSERLEYELAVIKKTGFASYFLIVWDLIKFSKDNGIPVGPGRGSAAGSIVSYLLGITDIDPLKYDLLFERFLNPARISMPDIDMDFCYVKRSRVLEYVAQKYGKDNVAQIVTFGTMLARAVVRDVSRVMDFAYSEADKIAKMIPVIVGKHVDLQEALKLNPDLKKNYESDPRVKKLIDVAMRLEGLSRHASTHAAGVVISDKPLMERIPLMRGSEGETVTGFDMESLEKTGLLKMDFLGLKTLTVIEEAVRLIKKDKGLSLDMGVIPLDDAATFKLLARADTIGIFQLESSGMRGILTKLGPSRFEDLIAVLALYRPGPLGSGMVDDFIERKQGLKNIVYAHPKLEPILKSTYGIILYQEQTMQIVSALAGFDMGQADLLRKAIGKKIPEIMEEQRSRFVDGCKKNGIAEQTATKIFDLIDYFSGYGFNRSHSAAYAMISYRTAYLKANFGVQFMAAMLTSEQGDTDKIMEYVNESSNMGIKVLPPDINASDISFTVTPESNIRFGLMAVKNVGVAALENLIALRNEKRFESIFDFCERVDSRSVNKKVVESLIKVGAMDCFGLKRAQMTAMLDRLLAKSAKKHDDSQIMLFEIPKNESVPDIEEWPSAQILNFEKSLLGIYITGHPLDAYAWILKYIKRDRICDFYEDHRDGEVTVCALIEKVRGITTKRKNERMAIMQVEDASGSLDVFVFPRLFEETNYMLQEKAAIVLQGKLEIKEKQPKILAERIISMDKAMSGLKSARISIRSEKFDLSRLKEILAANRGSVPVVFVFDDSRFAGMKIRANDQMSFNPTPENLAAIAELVGEKNLSLVL